MHKSNHRTMLRHATGTQLNSVIKQIRAENPGAFHVEHGDANAKETLSTRAFFDEPARHIPMRGFVIHRYRQAA
jgi:hypothetical protein